MLTAPIQPLEMFHFQKFATNSFREYLTLGLFSSVLVFFFLLFKRFLVIEWKELCNIYFKKYLISSGDLQDSCHFDPPSKCLHSFYSLEIQKQIVLFSFFFLLNWLKELKYLQLKREERFKHHRQKKRNTSISVYSLGSCFFLLLLSIFCIPFGRSLFVFASNEYNWLIVFFSSQYIEISLNNI